MFRDISYEKIDSVALIRLNRPESLNAYTVRMGEEIVAVFNDIRADETVKAVVLCGAGQGFCAGVDLKQLKKKTGDETLPALGQEYFVQRFCKDLFDFPKPVIAALHGHAIGVGVTMTLTCDIRLAASDAKLSLPFVKLGIVPGLGSSYMLPRLLGPGRAKLLALTGRTLSGSEALQFGLVDIVVPKESLVSEALAIAEEISRYSPDVVRRIKEAFNHGVEAASLETAAQFEHYQNAKGL